jgi:hypothetical protein
VGWGWGKSFLVGVVADPCKPPCTLVVWTRRCCPCPLPQKRQAAELAIARLQEQYQGVEAPLTGQVCVSPSNKEVLP